MTALLDRNGRETQPHTGVNAKGRVTTRNFGVDRCSESTYECQGCGKVFTAFDMHYYSLANDGPRIFALNRGRAIGHAARCKGTGR